MCVNVGLVDRPSVHKDVRIGGERDCRVLCDGPVPRRVLSVARAPLLMSKRSGVHSGGPVSNRLRTPNPGFFPTYPVHSRTIDILRCLRIPPADRIDL